jgi:tRNA1Val (adenine37-N6)-methyltransferase
MTGFRDSAKDGNGGPDGCVRTGFAGLSLCQPARGYRFSIDAVLLADFAASFAGESVLDLGAGCGVVLLLLAGSRSSLRRGVGVEIQRGLWECLRRNIAENGLAGRVTAVLGDFRDPAAFAAGERFDLVVSNPPYRRAGEGRRNPDPQKETARHEVAGTLDDLMKAARYRLSDRGTFAMVGPARRLPEILATSKERGIAPRVLRFVHPFCDRPANLVLYAGSAGRAPEPVILPPLVVYAQKGRYHPDVERIYGGLPTPRRRFP